MPANNAATYGDHEKLNARFSHFYACMILLFPWLWGSAIDVIDQHIQKKT